MKYKREISLSKILHIIKNKFLILFSFVVAFCSLSFAFSGIKHLYNNPYISNATIVSNQNLTNKSIGTMSKLVTSTLVCNEVSFKLAEEGIKFSSGEEITPSYIQSNLSSSFKINTNRINVSFKSDEKNIIEQTLNAVLETAMEQSAKFDTLKNRFEIVSHASPASRNFNTIILKNALKRCAAMTI